ncbi:MAG: DMT family transporter [Synergistaceae bacterium]|jgi:drug/metabolite transporter (DMT)-like permease|nr:DMT family transporter [Synergistaceae bacterium]
MPVWGFLLSMLVALMWAVSPVLMKEGLKFCMPNDIQPIRSVSFLVSTAILMLAFQPGRMPHVTMPLFAGLVGSTALSTLLGDLLYTYSIQRIGASLAVSVSSGYPLITAVVSISLLGEHVTALVWFGTFLIISGLLVIKFDSSLQEKMKTPAGYVLPDREEAAKNRANMTKGIALALGSAVCSGINIPIVKLLMVEGGWSPTESYFLRAAVFFAMAWGLREAQHRVAPKSISQIEKMPAIAWAALLASGVIGIGLSGVLFGKCIQEFPVSVVTPITASSPFMTALLSKIFFKETLSRVQYAGVALVIAGSVSVSL